MMAADHPSVKMESLLYYTLAFMEGGRVEGRAGAVTSTKGEGHVHRFMLITWDPPFGK